MALFDPRTTVMNWASILIQGPMDSEFFAAEFQTNRNSLHIGSQGLATFVVSADESGMVTITLSPKSITNRLLSTAFAANVIGPLLMKDRSDTTLVSGPETMIATHAPIKRGKEIIGMEWKFLVAKMLMIAGGDQ